MLRLVNVRLIIQIPFVIMASRVASTACNDLKNDLTSIFREISSQLTRLKLTAEEVAQKSNDMLEQGKREATDIYRPFSSNIDLCGNDPNCNVRAKLLG